MVMPPVILLRWTKRATSFLLAGERIGSRLKASNSSARKSKPCLTPCRALRKVEFSWILNLKLWLPNWSAHPVRQNSLKSYCGKKSIHARFQAAFKLWKVSRVLQMENCVEVELFPTLSFALASRCLEGHNRQR